MGSTKSEQVEDKIPKPGKLEDLDLNKLSDLAFNSMIFRLSPILGGRSEVLNTPIIEALSYLDMERKDKEAKKMDLFSMIFFGANDKVDGKARKKYYDSIRPKESGRKILGNPSKKLEWDYGSMDEFRAKE